MLAGHRLRNNNVFQSILLLLTISDITIPLTNIDIRISLVSALIVNIIYLNIALLKNFIITFSIILIPCCLNSIISYSDFEGSIYLLILLIGIIMQGTAVGSLLSPSEHNNKSSTVKITYILLILVLIGIIQKTMLGFDRPPFVFYETSYITYWLVPLFIVLKIEKSSTKNTNKDRINECFLVILFISILIISQSILLFLTALLITVLITILKTTKSSLISKIYRVFILSLLLIILIFAINITDRGKNFISSINSSFNDKNTSIFTTIARQAGSRSSQYIAPLFLLQKEDAINIFLGGNIKSEKNTLDTYLSKKTFILGQEIYVNPNSIDISLPYLGFFGQIVKIGMWGVLSWLILSIRLQKKGSITFEIAIIISTFFIFSISSNMYYGLISALPLLSEYWNSCRRY